MRFGLFKRWTTAAATPLLLFCLAFGLVPSVQAARQALVIGNAAYNEGALRNPVNDARAMEQKLAALGFNVTKVENLRRQQIGRTMKAFLDALKPGDEVVFFYAGHGVQVKGVNYLPAVDADIQGEDDVPLNSLNVNSLLDRLEDAKVGLKLLFLDACRNNPYARSFRSGERGLARVAGGSSGTLMHFATRPGSVAADGGGANGLYTSMLLRHIDAPDLPVELMLKRVTAAVEAESKGAQEPWTEGSIRGDFYFQRGAAVQARPGPQPEPMGQVATVTHEPVRPTPEAPRLAQLRAGEVFKDCIDCPEMVVIPAGSFVMGKPAEKTVGFPYEGPQHTVRINYRLAIGRHEVSRGEFARFVQATGFRTDAETGGGCNIWNSKWETPAGTYWRQPGFEQGEDHPAVCISWNDAQAYVRWLNQQAPGADYRLPSEAEWEYAARAGRSTGYPWGDDEIDNIQCAYANAFDRRAAARPGLPSTDAANCDDGYAYTAPAKALRPNAFGLYNMHGNAMEWVQDVFHSGYAGSPADGSAWTTSDDDETRVIRGGAWMSITPGLRLDKRGSLFPNDQNFQTGFRLARTL